MFDFLRSKRRTPPPALPAGAEPAPEPLAAVPERAPEPRPELVPAPLPAAAGAELAQLAAGLPDVLFVGLTDLATGQRQLSHALSRADALPAAPVAHYHAKLMQLHHDALRQALPPGSAADPAPGPVAGPHEVVLTLTDQLHLLRPVLAGQWLLSVVLEARLGGLPAARAALRAAAQRLDAPPGS